VVPQVKPTGGCKIGPVNSMGDNPTGLGSKVGILGSGGGKRIENFFLGNGKRSGGIVNPAQKGPGNTRQRQGWRKMLRGVYSRAIGPQEARRWGILNQTKGQNCVDFVEGRVGGMSPMGGGMGGN